MYLNLFRFTSVVAILFLFVFGCNNDELKKRETQPGTDGEQNPMKSEPLPPNTTPQDREGYYNRFPKRSIVA